MAKVIEGGYYCDACGKFVRVVVESQLCHICAECIQKSAILMREYLLERE